MPSVWSAVTPASTAFGLATFDASTSVMISPSASVPAQERAANSVCSLPPCGGGLGRGVVRLSTSVHESRDPHPQPLPTRGRGARRVRGIVLHQAQRRARQSLL